jgi:enterochelin esterase-like enzyme
MTDYNSIISPRLDALQKELEKENARALDDFWEEVTRQGTPLIEDIPGDNEHASVTFLWRSSEISSVSVISLLTNPTTHPLTRLLDTDVWYITCKVRTDIRATYQFIVQDASQTNETNDDPMSRWAKYQHDPLNPHTFNFFTEGEDPIGVKFTRSILTMPEATPQPFIKPRTDTPQGKVEIRQLKSNILDNERRVWVYTPPNYDPSQNNPYGLFILFDGWAYANLVPTFTILDNLISDGIIPPIVAVLPDSPDNNEARLQELIFHKPFNNFLVTELIPWVREKYHVNHHPSQTILGGSSAGGLAAAYAAVEHPEIFGNVLAQSGAFAFSPQGKEEPEWLARQIAKKDKLPLKFHLDAGVLEVNSLRDIGNGPTLLTATRHMRDVLQAKNYNVHYVELTGGHDYISWQGSLADGLQALIGQPYSTPM